VGGGRVRSRQHRKLPLPASFKPEHREHWLDRHEREVEEHEELLRKLEASEGRLKNIDGDRDRT
jgi:hypothetical protein